MLIKVPVIILLAIMGFTLLLIGVVLAIGLFIKSKSETKTPENNE
jgi:uncharacterized membrane protein